MGSKIKRSLFKYLIISLTISIILSIAVQDAAQNISDNIQLKYTDSSKLYEYQNGYSQLFGDVPQIPDVSPEIMIPSDRIAKELCDFISSWCILFFTLFGVFLSLTLFYKRRLKTPFSVLNEAADKISRQDLDFKISYVYDDELGQICAAFEKMREKLAENNSSMWNMINEQKQMRSAFSHDLRTPLTAICGYLDLLEQEEKSTTIERYIEIIRNRADLLTELIEELFRYSVIISGERLVVREPIAINGILEESIAAFYTTLNKRGIVPNIKITQAKIVRSLDRSSLIRVFSNLLNNAIKYSDGDLDITLTDSGEVIFANTASRLNEVQVGKLFDRFYTVEAARKSTGLGLAIARTLIEQMNGTISAKYENGRLSICIFFPDISHTET